MKKAQVYCLGLEWDHHGGSIICAWEGVSWGRGQGWPLQKKAISCRRSVGRKGPEHERIPNVWRM